MCAPDPGPYGQQAWDPCIFRLHFLRPEYARRAENKNGGMKNEEKQNGRIDGRCAGGGPVDDRVFRKRRYRNEAGGGRRGDGDRNGRNVCGERGIPGFRRREQGKGGGCIDRK